MCHAFYFLASYKNTPTNSLDDPEYDKFDNLKTFGQKWL